MAETELIFLKNVRLPKILLETSNFRRHRKSSGKILSDILRNEQDGQPIPLLIDNSHKRSVAALLAEDRDIAFRLKEKKFPVSGSSRSISDCEMTFWRNFHPRLYMDEIDRHPAFFARHKSCRCQSENFQPKNLF